MKKHMNKSIKIFTLFLIAAFNNTYSKPNFISKFYCSLLGNQDVSSEYQTLVQKALKDFDVKNIPNIPIKQMNKTGPRIAKIDLSSFTAFGIWFNQEYLDLYSKEEKIFNIYHEVSHYVLNHHEKTLCILGITFLLMGIGIKQLNTLLNPLKPLVKNGILTTTGILGLIGIYKYLLPYVVKRQEKQADILAAQKLIESGIQT